NILVGFDGEESARWKDSYTRDPTFGSIILALKEGKDKDGSHDTRYHYSEEGLLFCEDWNGNYRLCVPAELRNQIMAEVHDSKTESAHGG
ncbi:hypothetical protein K435DRAFT_618894, partial [Dendrothele bispora CBS 962.96]